MRSSKKGFTLIELLIVIGILGILAAIILVAVDPAKRLKQARNARRASEVNALLNAILNYTVDNRGTLPSAIASATAVQLGSGTGACSTTTAVYGGCDALTRQGIKTPTDCTNLGADTALVDAYIASIPVDPKGSDATGTALTAARTGYYVMRSANGRITVGACNAEDEGSGIPDISVKR